MSSYLLDTNVFIEAKNRYYAFDLAEGFWSQLRDASTREQVLSLAQVRDELEKREDSLTTWVKQNNFLFKGIDEEAAPLLVEVARWVNEQQYTAAAINQFLQSTADYYLVAYAAAHDLTIVTHETASPSGRKRIKIPDVCGAFGVPVCDTFNMMRQVGIKLG